MPLFLKENQELNKRVYKLPNELTKHLKQTLAQYGQYSQSKGYKRLNSLVNPSYNKRSDRKDVSKDGKHITFTDMKRIDHDLRHMSKNPNNLQRILNGGDEMARFVRTTLNQERTRVAPTLKKEKIKSMEKNQTKPSTSAMKPVKIDGEDYHIHEELLREDNYHAYFQYMEDNGVREYLDMYERNENPWLPLIKPEMYQKALSEFTKFGHFINFPTKYIYQWMGIIMKNTALLRAATDICGHVQYMDVDAFIDFYFEGDYDKWNEYKEEIDEDDNYGAIWTFLDNHTNKNGQTFDEWNKLPDGSDALSDYGLGPLEKIIMEYNENKTPEEVIVIINKCLDIAHCRGDLASMFIIGGSQSLTQISEEYKRKKIYIREDQLKLLI